jgi:hypothetical protein
MQGKPTVIKFFAPVIEETVNALITTIDDKMQQGGLRTLFCERSGYHEVL